MFDPYRKYVSCIFCGSRDKLSREHIFGDSFADYLGVKQHWVAEQIVVGGPKPGVHEKRGSSPISRLAPRLLCDGCNSGTLGQVMQRSLPLLKSLCDGQKLDLTNGDRTIFRRYAERFAAIIDVCTSNEQVSEMNPQQQASYQVQLQHQNRTIVSFEARSAWLMGAKLESVKVHVGHHQGVLGLNPEFNVAHEPDLDGSWKRITLIAKQLALCIDVGEPRVAIPRSFAELSEVVGFPSLPDVTYDDYFALRNQDSDTLYWRTVLRSSDVVRDMERHVLSGGDLRQFWKLFQQNR